MLKVICTLINEGKEVFFIANVRTPHQLSINEAEKLKNALSEAIKKAKSHQMKLGKQHGEPLHG